MIYPPWAANYTGVYQATLGLTTQHGRSQICACFLEQSPYCQTRDWRFPLNTSQIKLNECEQKWTHNHLELESAKAPGVLKSNEEWSINSDSSTPLILDIDEDYFGVHLPARNLTDARFSESQVKSIDELIQYTFCPASPNLELVIDRWFAEVIQHTRELCFEPSSSRLLEEVLADCSGPLFRIIHKGLREHFNTWLCDVDVMEVSTNLTKIFTSLKHHPEKLLALEKIGLCLTMAWSTHLYEPRMNLCLGHNLPGSSLVEEHVPDKNEVFLLATHLATIMLALPREPNIITICRSSRDGYTPRWLQSFIEDIILGLLKRVFNVTEQEIHYSSALAGGPGGWEQRMHAKT